ncbi:MAG TPA: hypothetical protein VMI73_25525 [Trebonia sp.]|nr:hypothetical protein [Trebonia sp.]
MGSRPGESDGTGSSPDRAPRTPGDTPPSAPPPAPRDPRLAGFASADGQDQPNPSGHLALLADELSGPERRCQGATDNELIGLLQAWSKLESWAAAAKQGVIREMIRRDGIPSPGSDHGDLPETWSPSLRYELAAALACSTQSAETTAWLAWEQQARLKEIGSLLNDGTLTAAKARAVVETFKYLTDADAAAAEALIKDRLAGKTYPQVLRLAEQAALTVDPELAARRRQETQHKDARVSFFREQAGTAALSGRDLPPDEALAAMASVNARAQRYQDSEAFGDTRMDILRACAYLDLLNGVSPETRIASAEEHDEAADAAEALAYAEERATRAASPANTPSQPRSADLVVPLATLLGQAEHPGEIQGFGPLDPALARALAAAAAASPHTEICVTATSPEGYAIAHGCARPERRPRNSRPRNKGEPADSLTRLPARLNLTIPARALPGLGIQTGAPWTLTIPGDRQFTVRLTPVPTVECDHRYETPSYHPTDKLRHLIQIRDGTCTFPSCNRHARDSDFEHAQPYDQGGKTCACNAGARSRACHRVKQSPGWTVTQPAPGWHQWTTPSGRVYTQEPKRYPA